MGCVLRIQVTDSSEPEPTIISGATLNTSHYVKFRCNGNAFDQMRCWVNAMRCLVNNAASDIPVYKLLGGTSQY
jgi:hypothetical protein